MVPTARDRVLEAMEVLKEVLVDLVAASVSVLVQEHLLSKPPTPTPPSPTEEERVERVEEGRGREEKAKAEVIEEEEKVVGVDKEMVEVEDSIRVHREEDERKEKVRREKLSGLGSREWR